MYNLRIGALLSSGHAPVHGFSLASRCLTSIWLEPVLSVIVDVSEVRVAIWATYFCTCRVMASCSSDLPSKVWGPHRWKRMRVTTIFASTGSCEYGPTTIGQSWSPVFEVSRSVLVCFGRVSQQPCQPGFKWIKPPIAFAARVVQTLML